MTLHAYRGEILSVPSDPNTDGLDAIRYEADGLLVVEDGLVIDRGRYEDLNGRYGEVPVERLTGLLVPGFVDSHVHYPQLESIASYGEQLLNWLDRYIYPAEAAFADRAHAHTIAAAFLDELVRHGTTTALVFATVHEHSVDVLFEEALKRNMRLISGKTLMDLGPHFLRDTPEEGRAASEALISRWKGRGRLGYAVTPRYALSCSDEQLAIAGSLLAAHPDVLLHTHLAESLAESEAVAERFCDAADYLDVYDRFGLVGERSVFAHGIHMTQRAWSRCAQSGAGIAVCPTSNLFLGSGFFRFSEVDTHGVKLGLGSDIGAGTSLSMPFTAGMAFQVAQMESYELDPFRALYLATAGSAGLLGVADRIGGLLPGHEADFVVLDPTATPILARRTAKADLRDRLFACQILGDDRIVERTFVGGHCLYRKTAQPQP